MGQQLRLGLNQTPQIVCAQTSRHLLLERLFRPKEPIEAANGKYSSKAGVMSVEWHVLILGY